MSFVYKILGSVGCNAIALFLLTYIVDDITYTGGLKFFIVGGLFLGVLNTIVRPVIKAISFPLIFITGGLFLIIINVAILSLLSHGLNVINFEGITLIFPNFLSYVIGAVVFGLINWTFGFIK